MITAVEIKDAIFAAVKKCDLPASVNGKLLTTERPADSKKEDIQIRLAANVYSGFGDMQRAVVYILVYVPDIKNGTQYMDNVKRTRELSRICLEQLGVRNLISGFLIELEEQNIIEHTDKCTHIISNRLTIQIAK